MEQKSFKINKILFITEASFDIGYGHLYRSIAIANQFYKSKIKIEFVVFDKVSENIVLSHIENVKFRSLIDLKNTIADYNLIFLDVYKSSWSNYMWLTKFTNLKTVSVIDFAFKEFSIATDYVFQIGFQEFSFKEECYQIQNHKISKVYSGNDFFIFREEFKNIKKFQVKKNANKTLISMGGSDPYKLTEFVSKALLEIKTKLKITIVLGAEMTPRRLSEIYSIFLNSIHDVQFFQNTSNIASLMVDNDFAIINGGNTRFELAVIGVPFISVSFNETQNNIANILQNHRIGKNLGIYEKLNEEVIAKATEQIIQNYDERKTMSEHMKKTFSVDKNDIISQIVIKNFKLMS